MPYRNDARGDLIRRRDEAAERFEAAALRVRGAAGALARMRARLETELRAAELAVMEAEAQCRTAVRAGLAMDGGAHGRVRGALRTQGAIEALRRAMARKNAPAPPRAEAPSPDANVSYEQARANLAKAREARARLSARSAPTLANAQQRLADAVDEHDDAKERLAALELSLEHA